MKRNLFIAAMLVVAVNAYSQNFSGGTGTETDPYQVATAEQLQEVTNFPTACFKQVADIDLADVVWTPISTFTGVYDGGGYNIDNLSITNGDNGAGLFSRMNTPGVIKNVTLRYADIVAGNWSAILCGTNGNWEMAGGTIQDCTILESSLDGGSIVGAFAGVAGGSFINCRAINVNVVGSGEFTGGIAGDIEANNTGLFHDCVFYGTVIGSQKTGGIIGFFNNGGNVPSDPAIKNCVVYGSVSSATGTVGGILGMPNWNTNAVNIDNCAVFADVSGQCVGSIGGNALRGALTNSYATGKVTATGMLQNGEYFDVWNGGLCSVNFNGPISDCYFSGSISTPVSDVKVAGICGRNWPGIEVSRTYYNSDGASLGMGDGDAPESYETIAVLPEAMLDLDNFKFSDMSRWQISEGTTPYFSNQTAPLKISECNNSGISGTGEYDLESVYLIGSISEGILVPITINNGNWSATFGPDDVVATETITAIGFAKGKMPSMVTKAKVDSADGITVTAADNVGINSIYNVAGQRLNGIEDGKINIVIMTNGKAIKVSR